MVEHLARRTLEVLAFARADRHDEREHLKMELSLQAEWRYAQLYRGELHDGVDDGAIGALLERSAPMLLRLAMLMALTDLQTRIDAQHIDAAMARIRLATASVRFVLVSAAEDARLVQVLELSNRVLVFLGEHGQATRSQISTECFRGKVPKARIDNSLEHLLSATPPKSCLPLTFNVTRCVLGRSSLSARALSAYAISRQPISIGSPVPWPFFKKTIY